MLNEFQQCLLSLMRGPGLLASNVDVRFELPQPEWLVSLTRPTINFHLFHLEENLDLRRTALETSRGTRQAITRVPVRRFDLHYMVMAIASSTADQHTLLWHTLGILMKHSVLPTDNLSPQLQAMNVALQGRIDSSSAGAPKLQELWSAYRLPPRPGLHYILTVPVDLDASFSSPLVLTRTLRVGTGPEAVPDLSSVLVGGQVRTMDGLPAAYAVVQRIGSAAPASVADMHGRFTLDRVPTGELHLEVTYQDTVTQIQVSAPAPAYDITVGNTMS